MMGAMPEAIFDRLSRILRMEAQNEPSIVYCCWNSCIKLMVTVGPAVEPQVTSRPPRLRQSREPLKASPPTCSKTTSTPFFAVSLRVTPSKRSVFFCLRVVANCRNDSAADGLCHLDGHRTDAGAACVHQNGFARFELGVVEQHVFNGTKGNRSARRVS